MAKGPIVLQPGLLLVKPQYTPNPDTGDQPTNILWFVSAQTTTPTLANLQLMAQAFDPGWGSIFAAYGAQGHTYTGSIWQDYSNVYGLTWNSVGTYGGTTGNNGSPLPSQTAILLSLHIQERWKGGHPRIYLPWVGLTAQSTTDNNKVLPAVLTSLQAAFSNLNGHTTGSGALGGQSQRVYRQKQVPGSAHLAQINTFTVQPTFATQRRRIRRAPHH